MDKEGILSTTGDWIKISIKFSGVCLHCKKRLNSGEYGYWSKGSRSILHETCYDSMVYPFSIKRESSSNDTEVAVLDKAGNKAVSQKNKVGDTGNSANRVKIGGDISSSSDGNIGRINNNNNNNDDYISSTSTSSNMISRKRAKNTKCFICSKYVDFENYLIISLLKLAEGYHCNSDILYCHDCLENPFNDAYENYTKRFVSAL